MADEASKLALIVGAGIGGLAAGVALQRAGWSVTVLEQAPQLREVGFALLLAPNAMRALRLLGVADAVLADAGVARSGELRRFDGRRLRQIDIRKISDVLGESTVCALRPVLHGALLSALGTESIRAGARVLSFTQDAAGVSVTIEGGETLRAQLLVGADGIHSTVRRLLHGETALRPSGLTGFRGVARGATFEGGDGAQYFGRGLEAGVGYAGSGGVYWYVSMPDRALPPGDLSPKQALLTRLATIKVDPALLQLIERTDPADMRSDRLVDRAPLQRWGQGRVTLLGDAAHPMLPHAGQGAAQALEDAVILGRSLTDASDVPAALADYESLRKPRSAGLVRISRRNAGMAGLDNPIACGLRDGLMRLVPTPLLARQLIALSRAPF